ncbi:hypothetical protein [Methylosinus sp. PW1]|uniref:hypothetical protein n=1 Tax=Methylosinus sp. PW1 TaxID=107636 RepID=UPI00055BA224|nr:hypothetical protein [Methylosinus sp. PW1]
MSDCFLTRKEAGDYMSATYRFGAAKSLAKAVVTGDGPPYRKAGRRVLYRREDLDAWAASKIGAPRTSTSESRKASRERRAVV